MPNPNQFKTRSTEKERLDLGEYSPAEYALWQKEMRVINRWLGDYRALKLSLNGFSQSETISILDIGAGAGDLLAWAGEITGGRFLVGAELSRGAAKTIAARPGLKAVRCDALSLPFADNTFDIVISSLFLHHLADDDVITCVREAARVARRQIVMIDLHRSPRAYRLYKFLAPLFFQPFTVEDGALSILRGFQTGELRHLAEKAGVRDVRVVNHRHARLALIGTLSRYVER